MSFTNAPVTRLLVVGLVGSSIAASLFDVKHYFYILVDLHIWRYRQFWRAFAFQLCYTNSAEVLFAAITLYHMRLVERMWGPRKYASFLLTCACLLSVLTPSVFALFARPLTGGFINYLPAGPTALIFAIVAQYHAMIPHTYQYRVTAASSSRDADEPGKGLSLSDKSYRYALALHLALLQWPGSVVAAATGWVLGYLWRNDILPQALTQWRVPAWLVGEVDRGRKEFENLRRRIEGESSAAGETSGMDVAGDGRSGRRRVGEQVLGRLHSS